MRISYVAVTSIPHKGGLSTFTMQIADALRKRGHQASILTPSQMPGNWPVMIDRLSALTRVTLRSWVWFFLRLWLLTMAMRLLFSRERLWDRTGLIDAQDPLVFLGLYKAAARRKVPIILTVHGYFHYESNAGSIDLKSLWASILIRIERRAYAAARSIVAVDSRIRDYVIRNGANRDSVIVRLNFVDCGKFSPATKEEKVRERERLGIPPDAHVVCCTRRLARKCGVEFAIRAMKLLQDRDDRPKLIIAGDGTLRNELENLVETLGIQNEVRFLGSINQEGIIKLLKASDVAVVPSITVGQQVEASSFSALEAMAVGIPVVASDIGGLKEVIVNGQTGILVPEGDPDSLAEAIVSTFGQRGQSIGRMARNDVLARFSLEHGVQQTLAIYEDLGAPDAR